jgi:hypothetical protein
MAINFPDTPVLNEVHTEAGISWRWTGAVWISVTGSPATTPAIATLTYAATTDIAFTDAAQRLSLTLTGDITFTGSGYADTREVVVFITGDSVLRTVAFPADWVFVGEKPADIGISIKAILSLQCIGSAATDVRAAWGVQT